MIPYHGGLGVSETKYARTEFGERDQNVVKRKHWIYCSQQIPVLFLSQYFCHSVRNQLPRLCSGLWLLRKGFLDYPLAAGCNCTYYTTLS
jgi:hypothetical protein